MKWYEDKEYQLMCEKAEEIQKIAQKNLPRLYYAKVYVHEDGRWFKELTWLLSQEDLQEMHCNYFKCKWIQMERHFYEWIYTSGVGVWDLREKALLAFVMHELYQKKWNPEKKEWEELK